MPPQSIPFTEARTVENPILERLRTLELGWRNYDQKELDFVEEGGGRFDGFELKWSGGSARGAKAFLPWYPESSVEVIEPGNVWDFAGVKGGNP